MDDLAGNGRPPQVQDSQFPLIPLVGCDLTVGFTPGRPDEKAILIGPLIIAIPLGPEAARLVVQGLTGIVVASALPPEQES